MGSGPKSFMRKGFLIYEEMCKYLTIYEEAVSQIWLFNRSLLNFLIYEKNFLFFFISEVGITIKFCVFLRIDSLWEPKFGVILALFVNFECIIAYAQKRYISDILHKLKKFIVFPITHSLFESELRKSIKCKASNLQCAYRL
jgi:hypothetical protein